MEKKEEVKLSIVVLTCDKDFRLTEKLVKQINEKVKINHEIVICDNRVAYKDRKADFGNAKIYSPGKNLFIFEGRRQTVLQMCRGEYIWFVDADDEVCELEKFDFDEDLVCFNYWACTDKAEPVSCKEPYFVSYTANNAAFFCYSWRSVCKNMVWNKFYRRDVLLQVYRMLPNGLEINFMEDTLLNTLVLGRVKSIRFEREYFYKYYFAAGDSTKDVYKDMATLERCFKGFDTVLGLLQTMLPAETQDVTGISANGFYNGSAFFFMRKILLCTPQIRPKFIKFCEKYYTLSHLRSLLPGMPDATEEEKRQIAEYLAPKPLVILGKGECEYTIQQMHDKGFEVWTVGTFEGDGADRYYEWHGIENGREVIRAYPDYLRKYEGLPLNNSISNMLIIAYEEGYKHIELLGCQMASKEEYLNQRAAVGMVVGFLMGKGLELNWIGQPENIRYGRP